MALAGTLLLSLPPPLYLTAILLAFSLSSPELLPRILTTSDEASLLLFGIGWGLIGGGFLEELGWTGFAVPTLLRQRYGVLSTGLLVGVLWGAWHLLGNDIWASVATSGGLPLALFVVFRGLSLLVGQLLAYRVLMVWVYERTGSLLLAILMHASFAASTFILNPVAGPGTMSGSSLLTYDLVLAAALWIFVGMVAVANGGHSSRRPLSRRRVA